MIQPLRPERVTQNRVVQRFTAPISTGGLAYRSLGDWHQREHNRGIEAEILRKNLEDRGYSNAQIGAALQKLETAADSTGITLYAANLRTYQLLRYGVPVQTAAGQAHETVHLIDWKNPEKNDFALAGLLQIVPKSNNQDIKKLDVGISFVFRSVEFAIKPRVQAGCDNLSA